MTKAEEVRALAGFVDNDREVAATLRAYADLLEERERQAVPAWVFAELAAECNYHVNGRCDTLKCARTNGCAAAHILFAYQDRAEAAKSRK